MVYIVKKKKANRQRIVYKKTSQLYLLGGKTMGKSSAVVLITRIAPETGTRGGRVVMFRPTHPIKPHQSGRDGSGRLDIKRKKTVNPTSLLRISHPHLLPQLAPWALTLTVAAHVVHHEHSTLPTLSPSPVPVVRGR